MAEQTQLMKGILEGCVLATLAREPSYGYRVVERMRGLGFADIAEATVYPILTRLEKKGALRFEKRASKKGPPRKVYSLTAAGRDALSRFAENWRDMAGVVEKALEEKE